MKFIISRTSVYGEDVAPHPKAYKKLSLYRDERGFDSPYKIPAFKGTEGDWYEKGINHRVENGHIVRDFPEEFWFINIDSLQELLDFVDDNGEVILGQRNYHYSIEIYDDYRE